MENFNDVKLPALEIHVFGERFSAIFHTSQIIANFVLNLAQIFVTMATRVSLR